MATDCMRCGSPVYSRKPCNKGPIGTSIAVHKAKAAKALLALCLPLIRKASAGIKRFNLKGSSSTSAFLRRRFAFNSRASASGSAHTNQSMPPAAVS